MRLFHRKTLNERLLDEAVRAPRAPGEGAGEPAGPDPLDPLPAYADVGLLAGAGSTTDAAGYARQWPMWVSASAPGIEGDLVEFVALPDGSLVVDEEQGDADLDPLAQAVEARLAPPYRARAVPQGEGIWTICARPTRVEELLAEGAELELVVTESGRRVTVDGSPSAALVPELERIGKREGTTYAVHASRLDGDLWEVTAGPLQGTPGGGRAQADEAEPLP